MPEWLLGMDIHIERQRKKNGNSNIHYCLSEANEILIWLANAILSGIAWDVIKTTVSKLSASIKNRTSVDAETRQVLSDDDELAKFYEYIKDYERGFSSINENEYKYIEEEMIADFYAENISVPLKWDELNN